MAGTIRRSSLRLPFVVAAVPYAWGLAIWLVASFAAYLAAIRAILPRQGTLLVAAAFPAVFVNVGHGQNGFLTAALLGGALHWLDRRPWLAGVLIGLLGLQAAIRRADSDGASGRRTLAHDRRGGSHRCSAGRCQLRAARQRHLARLRRLDEFHADRRARTGRHRLGEDPVDLLRRCGRGARACPRPMRRRPRCSPCSPPASRGCGTAMPPSN